MTPLLQLMRERGIQPYADSEIAAKSGVNRRLLGMIATGRRRCTIETLLRIERAAQAPYLAGQMLLHWLGQEQQARSKSRSEATCSHS